MHPSGPHSGQTADPCVMTIFGASGDLTKRKLIPALCNLMEAKLLPHNFALIGFSSGDFSTESFRAQLTAEIKDFVSDPIDPKIWSWLMERTYYIKGDFGNAADFQKLKEQIAAASKAHQAGENKYFYMAVAPRFFAPVVQQLGQAGLTKQDGGHYTRVIVEKPFGQDSVIREDAAFDPDRDFELHVASIRNAFTELAEQMNSANEP